MRKRNRILMLVALSVLAIMMILPTAVFAAGDNLLKDPSFETGAKGNGWEWETNGEVNWSEGEKCY